MLFADRLKELRKEKGLTQDNMAKLLCIKRQTYSVYERQICLHDVKKENVITISDIKIKLQQFQ
jgi:DNA-binding XRE family transcriptional regulator